MKISGECFISESYQNVSLVLLLIDVFKIIIMVTRLELLKDTVRFHSWKATSPCHFTTFIPC